MIIEHSSGNSSIERLFSDMLMMSEPLQKVSLFEVRRILTDLGHTGSSAIYEETDSDNEL